MREVTQICRGFTDEQWLGLRGRLSGGDEDAWACAIDVFARRIRERFISCIEVLADADSRLDIEVPLGAPADCSTLPDDGGRRVTAPGFAIMALCCLLLETLQSFREAPGEPAELAGPCTYPPGPCIRPATGTTEQLRRFLRRPAFNGAFDDGRIGRDFVSGIRNGVFHEAATRGWVIWREDPEGQIVEPYGDGYALNRGEFYRALKNEFETYLHELRDPLNSSLRARFMKKVTDVAKEC